MNEVSKRRRWQMTELDIGPYNTEGVRVAACRVKPGLLAA